MGRGNKLESKNPDDDERKVDPGTARTLKTQGTLLTQSYVSNIFMTEIPHEWVMSTIEDKLASPTVLSSVQACIESSRH